MRELLQHMPTEGDATAVEGASASAGTCEARLVELARRDGWKRAAHDFLRAHDLLEYRLAVDEYRGNWRILLPITRRSRLLELNCDHGAASLVLAEGAGLTVALDDRWERVAFAALRGQQEHVPNLSAICASPTASLPFRDASFDVVAYSGALARNSAARLLAEVARVLAPGGHVYLATRNRIGLGGGRDRPAPRGLTMGGLRGLLKAAGFSQVAMYAPLPSHELAFFFVPLDDPPVFAYYLRRLFEVYDFGADLRRQGLGWLHLAARHGSRAARRLRLAGLARHLVPSIAAVARK